MCYEAFDVFGRAVFFEERLRKKERDTFPAYEKSGEQFFYRTRHREDGPAIIDRKQGRRWFFYGEEKTKEVEEAICHSGVECFESLCDFRLNQAGKDVVDMALFL